MDRTASDYGGPHRLMRSLFHRVSSWLIWRSASHISTPNLSQLITQLKKITSHLETTTLTAGNKCLALDIYEHFLSVFPPANASLMYWCFTLAWISVLAYSWMYIPRWPKVPWHCSWSSSKRSNASGWPYKSQYDSSHSYMDRKRHSIWWCGVFCPGMGASLEGVARLLHGPSARFWQAL